MFESTLSRVILLSFLSRAYPAERDPRSPGTCSVLHCYLVSSLLLHLCHHFVHLGPILYGLIHFLFTFSFLLFIIKYLWPCLQRS